MKINLGIQIAPILAREEGFPIIDECIGIIQKSGIPYTVTPFEKDEIRGYFGIRILMMLEKGQHLSVQQFYSKRLYPTNTRTDFFLI